MGDALAELHRAVEKFAAASNDDSSAIVSQALVVFEMVGFDDDGTAQRQIRYANSSDNFSMSGALGLLEAARFYVRQDIFSLDSGEDDD